MPPEKIARFEIVSEVGKSGAGSIYKATDPKTNRPVKLHTTPADASAECQARLAPFRQQAKSAAVLNSPNIAGIYGLGELEGQFFIVSEWVDGVLLKDKIKEGMSASELVDLTRQICTALDHAHGKGCVHPRLSPSSIQVEWDGTAKIMGFGIAPELEPPGTAEAAAPYQSPEQARGEPTTAKSNLFTWGAILYELATQQKPFGDTPGMLGARICDEVPPPAHEVNPKVHPGISQVIAKALAKSPAERYTSGAELLGDMENHKNLVKTEASPAPVKTPAPGTMRTPTVPPGTMAAPKVSAQPPATMHAPTPAPGTLRAPAAAAPAPAPVVTPQPLPPLPRPAPAKGGGIAQQKLLLAVGGAVILLLIVVGGLLLTRKPSGEDQPASTLTVREITPQEQQAVETLSAPGTTPAPAPAGTGPARPRSPKPAAAPVAAAPAVRNGELMISSTPEGAQVQIDGQAFGTTPLTANVPSGQHTIVVSKPGHAAVTRIVDVLPGSKATIPATLIELAATLSVSSDPAGANILVDGRDSGKVTPAQLVIGKGSHTVLVRKQGYLEESTTVELQPGTSSSFSPALKVMGSTQSIRSGGGIKKIFGGGKSADSAKLTVKTDPKGAQIMINNRMMDKAAPAEFYLEPGNYEVVLTMSGYKPLRKIVTAEKGGKLSIDEKMQH